MKIENTKDIFEAYTRQKDTFLCIENKSRECEKINHNMNIIRNECFELYKNIFSGFCSKREKLGLYTSSERYGEKEKQFEKWKIKSAKDKETSWNYRELCLNTMGFSLRWGYQEKSNSIFELPYNELVRFFVSLKQDIVMNKLKTILTQDKLELLNKAIENIKALEPRGYVERHKEYNFSAMDKTSKMKIIKSKGEDMTITTSDRNIYIIFGKNKKITAWNRDESEIEISNISLREKIIVEQTSEQIIYMLNEYMNQLKTEEAEHKGYLESIKDAFNNELIILSLTK